MCERWKFPARRPTKNRPAREVARTAPYMHDGSLATLTDVVEFYSEGGRFSQEPISTLLSCRVRPGEAAVARASRSEAARPWSGGARAE